MLERTLVLLKPSTIQRALIGEIINRFEKKGLRIAGMKMMQLDDAILEEHYAHLVKKPFFPSLKASMMKTICFLYQIPLWQWHLEKAKPLA